MSILSKVLVGFIAIEHLYILVLQMFMWTHPRTMRVLQTTHESAHHSKTLASNQGLYNGFLAAGLIWALVAPKDLGMQLALFFVGCVLVAGIFGGFTATRRIFVVQALPAAIALVSLLVT